MRIIKKLAWIILLLCICSFKSIEPSPHVIRNSIYKDIETKAILSDTQLYADSDICESTDCQNTGKSLNANLNTSADPCDDFYEFACGGWMASHKIPDNYPFYFDGLQKGIEIQKSINESLNKLKGKSGPKPIVYTSELYQSCLDIPTRKAQGFKPITDSLETIGGWPLVSGSFNETLFDWMESLTKMVQIFGDTPIFSFSVDTDANDTQVNRFYFKKAFLGLRIQVLTQGNYSKAVQEYKQIILRTALAVGAKNDSQTNQQIDEMVDFEAKLFNVTSDESTPQSTYNRMTFKALNNLSDNRVDWIKLLNNIYSKFNSSVRVSSDELVIVPNVNYYKNVPEIIEKTSKRTLSNYLGYILASKIGLLTAPAFRSFYDSEKSDLKTQNYQANLDEDDQLRALCLEVIAENLNHVPARLYVENNFSKKDKQESLVIIKDIKESFAELLKDNQWLDTTTKNKALQKLSAIRENVGYPDWILNDTQLENYYNLTQKVVPKDFVKSVLYLMMKTTTNSYNMLRHKPNLDFKWSFSPVSFNAAYEETQNTITIPAAFLAPPNFDTKIPAQINYGAIGAIVGHELTHAFDDGGSQYDLNGNLRNWWTEEASKRFKQRADCFVKEYNNILDTQTQMKLNGTKTLSENIADNGGIREAYNAYLKYVQRHGKQRLPLLNNYSAEQQFFISYANTWCMKFKTEFLKQVLPNLSHSPNKYRVNIPLANFKTFSDVFKCSTNSRMNTKDKCILW